MTVQRGRKRGLGALQIITGLLILSAVLRFGAQVGPAMANDASVEVADQPDMEIDSDVSETETLLFALQTRASQLSEREEMFQARMQALRTAEAQIDEKLQQLARAEEELSATIALADAAAETDVAQLTSVYENMKPKEAADLFAQMPPQFAAGFLGLMRPDTAASIMTELDPEIAYSFSVVLAGRNANVPTE